uniref:Uncharacterized protein LOC111100843 isoform X1 n=1 Tax=Crassostrea virginica TaxID=6565 RepID=A0A8B8ADU5_CRAVI|nr:uncharacterized protein LOC111100843 isoform X1 [Crassostrea virginica]
MANLHPPIAQDVYMCDYCSKPATREFSFCDKCNVNLCIDCVRKHCSSDKNTAHIIVPFLERFLRPKCVTHSDKVCDWQCEDCNISICSICRLNEHDGHNGIDVYKKKDLIAGDLRELEDSIFPTYENAGLSLPDQRDHLEKKFQKINEFLDQTRRALQNEIDNMIMKMQTNIKMFRDKHLSAINEKEEAIQSTIKEIKKRITEIKEILNCEDLDKVFAFRSRIREFEKLPAKIPTPLFNFPPQNFKREQIDCLLDSLSKLDFTDKPLTCPNVLTEIKTEFEELCSLSCRNDTEVWTCGNDNIIRLYNLHGKLLKSVPTCSQKMPCDIALTSTGLAYTDYNDKSINILVEDEAKQLIKLTGWIPLYLCCTFFDKLLVTMINDDMTEAKVVRYSGVTEELSIQFKNSDQPLYSSDSYPKYITENRNFDICMADCGANAVVVVNSSGTFRFSYKGNSQNVEKSFRPGGITTDSQGRILTADGNNKLIHILDQDGHFLCYIQNCTLRYPYGLCVDFEDNLYVAEWKTGYVKKIQYCK